ncbi:MAG: biotin synthase BioB [Deltaproteobacteria bacterium]|nr:biotin synthase BioB [Deltaproteobacteria bacterium]
MAKSGPTAKAPGPIGVAEAERLLGATGKEAVELYARAGRVAKGHARRGVHLCGVVNAKSGRCPEDCAFCAQSARSKTDAPVYSLMSEDDLFRAGDRAEREGLNCFGIVLSGRGLRSRSEVDRLCRVYRRFERAGFRFRRGLSAGILRRGDLKRLRDAGGQSFHHNLETARSFYPSICTTRTYDDNVAAILLAREAGFEICSGALFGMGESDAQRVELAIHLGELAVVSIPLNFLSPIPGTPLERQNDLKPEKCLNIIAVYRLLLPEADLHVCGGRPRHLAKSSETIFSAGASGMMTGNYLTTPGFAPADDRRMIKRAGLAQRARPDR